MTPFERQYNLADVLKYTGLDESIARVWLRAGIIKSTAGVALSRGRETPYTFRDLLVAVNCAGLRKIGIERSAVEKASKLLYGSAWKGKEVIVFVGGDPSLKSLPEARRLVAIHGELLMINLRAVTARLAAAIEQSLMMCATESN